MILFKDITCIMDIEVREGGRQHIEAILSNSPFFINDSGTRIRLKEQPCEGTFGNNELYDIAPYISRGWILLIIDDTDFAGLDGYDEQWSHYQFANGTVRQSDSYTILHKCTFVLGAQDPEMDRIEEVLQERGYNIQHATVNGQRVHPWEAYKIAPVDGYAVIYVECAPGDTDEYISIDHHNKGHLGYGLPPNRYWEASSIGQLYRLLEITAIPHEDLVLAAMDHCPAAAIAGQCPSVSAQEVLDRKIDELSKWLKQPIDLIRIRILECETLIKDLPTIVLAEQQVKDGRAVVYGAASDLNLRCASIAALHMGVAILFRQKYDGREEWSLQGHCTPECIIEFKNVWGPAQGLSPSSIYGVPSRGYAGGHIRQMDLYIRSLPHGFRFSPDKLPINHDDPKAVKEMQESLVHLAFGQIIFREDDDFVRSSHDEDQPRRKK